MCVWLDGGFERAELDFAIGHVQPGDCAIDVGAYVGWYTVPLARVVGSSGVVLAVEPVPTSCARLRSNLARAGVSNVVVFEVAAWSEATVLRVLRTEDPAFSSASTAVRGSSPAEEIQVRACSLDALWAAVGGPQVSFMKIDVEGSEVEVIRGARKLIERCSPVILVETDWPAKVLGHLAGYEVQQPAGFMPWNYVLRPKRSGGSQW
jgi:FkbM family methyltransferase